MYDIRGWSPVFLGEPGSTTRSGSFVVHGAWWSSPARVWLIGYRCTAIYGWQWKVSEDSGQCCVPGWSGTCWAEAAGSVPRDESGGMNPGAALYMGQEIVQKYTECTRRIIWRCEATWYRSTNRVDLYYPSSTYKGHGNPVRLLQTDSPVVKWINSTRHASLLGRPGYTWVSARGVPEVST